MMKKTTFMTVALSLALALAPALSEAKRLGGGRSSGMQRDMPARTAPDATPAKPATPQQQQAGTPAAANAANPAATPPKRSWMGPLAGLAAGLGIGALLSHFGLGGAFANAIGSFLMIALLALAGFALYRFFMSRRNGQKPAFAGAAAGNMGSGSTTRVAWPQAATPLPAATPASIVDSSATPTPTVSAEVPATPVVTRAFVPASFDSEGFARTAKALFIRLQAANDSGDLDDLRRFTTPEMFAELKVDLQDRSGDQTTDVVRVDADVLDIDDDGQRQIVSVRFHGQVREDAGATPVPFDEVWHLAKPHDDSRSWAIAGIEQQPEKTS